MQNPPDSPVSRNIFAIMGGSRPVATGFYLIGMEMDSHSLRSLRQKIRRREVYTKLPISSFVPIDGFADMGWGFVVASVNLSRGAWLIPLRVRRSHPWG